MAKNNYFALWRTSRLDGKDFGLKCRIFISVYTGEDSVYGPKICQVNKQDVLHKTTTHFIVIHINLIV